MNIFEVIGLRLAHVTISPRNHGTSGVRYTIADNEVGAGTVIRPRDPTAARRRGPDTPVIIRVRRDLDDDTLSAVLVDIPTYIVHDGGLGDDFPVDLAGLIADNREMDEDDIREIIALKVGEKHAGGGGAAPEWSITRVS